MRKNNTRIGVLFSWLRGPDLNRRPPCYGPGELPLLYPAMCSACRADHPLSAKGGSLGSARRLRSVCYANWKLTAPIVDGIYRLNEVLSSSKGVILSETLACRQAGRILRRQTKASRSFTASRRFRTTA